MAHRALLIAGWLAVATRHVSHAQMPGNSNPAAAGGASASDPGKYMKQYASGASAGGGSAANYQKYMKQYGSGTGSAGGGSAADYQKYMKQYGSGASGGGSAANYQKYMKQYGSGGSSAGGSSANYQKYMKQYGSGGSAGASAGGNYKKYMKQYSGSSSGGSAGPSSAADYKKYMKQYTGDSSGKSAASGGATAPTENFLQKFAGKIESLVETPVAASTDTLLDAPAGAAPAAKPTEQPEQPQFAQPYMEEYTTSPKNQSNGMDWKDAYLKKYAGDYAKYAGGFDATNPNGGSSDSKRADYWTKQYADGYQKYIKEGEKTAKKSKESKEKQDTVSLTPAEAAAFKEAEKKDKASGAGSPIELSQPHFVMTLPNAAACSFAAGIVFAALVSFAHRRYLTMRSFDEVNSNGYLSLV